MGSTEKPATETIAFGLEGRTYEIDLCDKHAKQFRDAIGPFAEAGRRTNSARSGARAAPDGDSNDDSGIRAWAKSKGMKVSELGRLSADIVARYEASGGR